MKQKPSLRDAASSLTQEGSPNPCSPPQVTEQYIKQSTCPVCTNNKAVSFYDGGEAPLTTLAWPKSQVEAQAMEKLTLDFVRCIGCGHIYNRGFHYENVPYGQKPNLMYNQGIVWQQHLQMTHELIAASLPHRPTILEIGTGDGHFLRSLAKRCPGGQYIGFDPNGSWSDFSGSDVSGSEVSGSDISGSEAKRSKTTNPDHELGVQLHAEWFEPSHHMADLKPDLIICRHLLEHLENPLDFIETLANAAIDADLSVALFVEVPCIEKAIQNGRTVDFFYEHPSQFTRQSLSRLLKQGGAVVEQLTCGYHDEVVYAYARLGRRLVHSGKKDPLTAKKEAEAVLTESLAFFHRAQTNDEQIRQQIKLVAASRKKVALWGGTGKAATFINRYEASAELFPLVVDSDEAKVGTYVPGTGQCIQKPDVLLHEPVEVIIITTPWRQEDILQEIQKRGIVCPEIWVEVEGSLKKIS